MLFQVLTQKSISSDLNLESNPGSLNKISTTYSFVFTYKHSMFFCMVYDLLFGNATTGANYKMRVILAWSCGGSTFSEVVLHLRKSPVARLLVLFWLCHQQNIPVSVCVSSCPFHSAPAYPRIYDHIIILFDWLHQTFTYWKHSSHRFLLFLLSNIARTLKYFFCLT